LKKNKTIFEIGKPVWYRDEWSGQISTGVIIKVTPHFCVMDVGGGNTKRKSQHLLSLSEDDAMLSTILSINDAIEDQFKVNINELHKMFTKMLAKYPEKFV